MRFLGLILLACLAACSTATAPMSSLPFPDLPRVPNISKAEQPYPSDYAAVVSRRLLARGESAEISAPARFEPWSINEPVGWSVCLRRAGDRVTLVVLGAEGKIAGGITPPPAGSCDTAAYAPIARPA